MRILLTLKNYRCFPRHRPARISLGPGFAAIVGPNNSGKSSLLRFFYEFRGLFRLLANSDTLARAEVGTTFGFDYPRTVADPTGLASNASTGDIELEVSLEDEPAQDPNGVPNATKAHLWIQRNVVSARVHLFSKDGRRVTDGFQKVTTAPGHLSAQGNVISNLESMRTAFAALMDSMYIPSFRNALDLKADQDYYDLKVGRAFLAWWNTVRVGKQKAINELVFGLSQDLRHLFGFQDLDISTSDDGSTLQLIIDGKSYSLDEIGSGFSGFLIVLSQAAVRQPSFILIDEPEANLHPTLQSDFLTTIGSHATIGTVFATHSLGLARASAQHVFSIVRVQQGESALGLLEATNHLTEFMGELSYGGYTALGFTTVLLVEGVSDTLVFQQWLREMKQDHRVLILPLGGDALLNGSQATQIQLAEVRRIAERVFVIIDSERTAENAPTSRNRSDFAKLAQDLGMDVLILHRRAVENYLTDAAIKQEKGTKYQALGPFQALTEVRPSWGKAENWRIARRMRVADLAGTDLGDTLQQVCAACTEGAISEG